MKTKLIIFISSMLILFSTVSCLKIPDEKNKKEIIIPDENFVTNTQNITVPYAVSISFANGKTEVINPFKENGVTVNVDGQNVTIISTTSNIEVNYVLSGNTFNGFVKIYSDLRFGLVLNGVSIFNRSGAAINIQSGRRVSVTLVDKTSNRLIDGGEFRMTEGEDMKATLFSEGQLIFMGNGSLLVYANYRHAICSDDYIRINSGNITVNNATTDGINCNDNFEMNGGNLVINAKSDGVDCSRGDITINGGTMRIKSNRNGFVSAEGSIAITGGLIVSSAAKNVFDCAKTFSITGGSAIGTGAATVIPNESASRQRTVVWGASKFTAGQLIYIKSSNNAEVLTFKFPRAYSDNMTLVYSSPLLQANTSYTIYKGGSVSGGSDFHGLYSGAVSSGGTTEATFTTSAMVTTVGNVMGL